MSEKKSEQLGIPFGTANNRLRKNVMFMLAQKCGMDICQRCNRTIESVDEFSLEHINPWLDINPELFWDLNNIAFSHHSCNIAAARRLPRMYNEEERRQRKNACMRRIYTTEKRREKFETTGW